jgi:acetate---CoA ligase (ADP-forming)
MSTTRTPPPYPSAHVVDVALRDGSTVHIRPVSERDGPAVRAFLESLSRQSVALRFFGAANLDWATDWSVEVDYSDRYALVATTGRDQAIVGHGAYVRVDESRAEVAFTISDSWQGRGIATIMLLHLAAAADEHGIDAFVAEVLPQNRRMLEVFGESGFSLRRRTRDRVIEFELPTSLSAQARERFEQREQTAAIAAVTSFLKPQAVAVIGASRSRGTVGGEILHNILTGEFSGAVYPVNSKARTVQALRAYRSISEVPERVELAVIVVPAEQVSDVAGECASAGVRALLVISAGFAEAGREGARRQEALLSVCRDAGMRLIGPNCLGVFNTASDVRLNATFAPRAPRPGRVGFLSQSGGLGIAIVEAADRLGLGLSSFVSVGNKADISGNDLLQFWERDADTDLVLLYLESFGNPRRFARIARRVSAVKPIIAVKSGRSPAGARAGASHTGALISASDVTVDALFRQAGVIRTDTMHELFDAASLLSAQPAPQGRRVAIVTNGGGPGILCADACEAGELEVPRLPAKVRRRLAGLLPAEASLENPIDMLATSTAASYRETIEALVQSEACDAIIAIFVPPLVTDPHDVAREINAAVANRGSARPVTAAAVFMLAEGPPAELALNGIRIPAFAFPEDAARALSHAARYARWRSRPPGRVVQPHGCRPLEAAAIVARALAAGAGWMNPGDVVGLLDCYRLPLIPTRVVGDPDAVVAAADEFGEPVALKAIAPGLLHKTDAGAVLLGLRGPRALRAGVRRIEAAVSAAGGELQGLIVQPMASPGVELLMGVVHDESFGPVLACGAGGTSAELLRDMAVRITPLTDLDAKEMLRSLRMFPLLAGYRGAPACDVAAVEEALHGLSALVEAHPEVAELDFNPVIARADGAVILDARVRLSAPPPRRPSPSLREQPKGGRRPRHLRGADVGRRIRRA